MANLGAVFAQAGERVVLVSCDLRRPRLSQLFRPANSPSCPLFWPESRRWTRRCTPVRRVEGLLVAGHRSTSPNPTELLSSRTPADLFAELAENFDLVLIDSPPVLPVADAMILSTYADGVLLVVAAGQTKRAELQRTAEKFARRRRRSWACVLNKVTTQNGYGSYGWYGTVRPLCARAIGPARAGGRARARERDRRCHRTKSDPGRRLTDFRSAILGDL